MRQTLIVVTAAAVLAAVVTACGSSGATSRSTAVPRAPLPSKPIGAPLRTRQSSLVGNATRSNSGYPAMMVLSAAGRSLAPGGRGRLITLPGIGGINVACSATPTAVFVRRRRPHRFTASVVRTDAVTSRRGRLSGMVRNPGAESISPREAARQRLVTWHILGGGEAFQVNVVVTALLTPTTTRCDLLAESTTVVNAPRLFYRAAQTTPTAGDHRG